MISTSFLHDSHLRIDLHEGWRLRIPTNATQLGSAAGTEIMSTVPGCVHLDLMQVRLLDDPYRSDGEVTARWVGELDWTYVKTIAPVELDPSLDRLQLVFEGLDTFAELRLDGELLASTDNMFHAHRFDLPLDFDSTIEHTLEVKFLSPLKTVDKIVEEKGPAPDSFGWHRGWARKAGYSYGWDWGPDLPTSGIYRPVYLQAWSSGRIGWFTPSFGLDGSHGRLAIKAATNLDRQGSWKLAAELKNGNSSLAVVNEENVGPGEWLCEQTIKIENPELWWPAGEGDQHLYTLDLRLYLDGDLVHEVSEEIGLREVEWVQEEDEWGRSFKLRLNGRDLFARGANWIPGDTFLPRMSDNDYVLSLGMAKRAGMNMLRVWGGGFYENPIFYRTCNRLGLLVWQDFMYACSLYPDDEGFRDNAMTEARWVLAELLRHPSIVLWCGNNEIERDAEEFQERFGTSYLGKTLWHEQLPQLVSEMADDVFYLPSSPYGGRFPNDPREGDRHVWSVWNGWGDPRLFHEEESRFVSEFGFQAPATLGTWEEYLNPEERQQQHRSYEIHNKQIDGPERIWRFLSALHHLPSTFEEMVLLAQDTQARALTTALMHWRSRKPRTMGTLIWQHNDCWPVTSWALVDWRDRPKPAWYRVARAYKQVGLALNVEGDTIFGWLLNDTQKSVTVELRLRALTLDGDVLRDESNQVTAAEDQHHLAFRVAKSDWVGDSKTQLLCLELLNGGEIDSSRVLLPMSPFKHLHMPRGEASLVVESQNGSPGVRVTAESVVFGVWIYDKQNPDLMLAENALDLLPGDDLWIPTEHCRTGEPLAANEPEIWWVRKDHS